MSSSLFLFIAILRLVLVLVRLAYDDSGPKPSGSTQPPTPLPWPDEAGKIRFFQQRLPFLDTPEGAAFLRAILPPDRQAALLHDLIKNVVTNVMTRSLLEAVYYWYPKKGRRKATHWQPGKPYTRITNYLEDLVRYLFEEHPVPPVVFQLWWRYKDSALPFVPGAVAPDEPADVLLLYFYATEGGGLRSAPFLRWELSRGAAGYIQEAPDWMSIHQAYWYAHFRVEGMPAGLPGPAFCVPAGFANTQFWRGLIRLWLRDKDASGQTDLLGLVIRQLEWLKFGIPHQQFLNNERFVPHYGAQPGLRLEGRSWATLLVYLEETVGLREFPLPRGMEPEYRIAGPNGQLYRFVHIASSLGMLQEGAAMSHCVGNEDYIEQARNGWTSFWSMRLAGPRTKRLLTIQLDGTQLSEAAGFANSEPTPEEMQIVDVWLNTCPDAAGVS